MNRCAYCLVKHSRPYACCCPEHTRKMAAWRGACTAGRNRARRRTLDVIHKRERHRQRWRDIAMGRNVQVRLFEVFGVTPLATFESSSPRARALRPAQLGASLG